MDPAVFEMLGQSIGIASGPARVGTVAPVANGTHDEPSSSSVGSWEPPLDGGGDSESAAAAAARPARLFVSAGSSSTAAATAAASTMPTMSKTRGGSGRGLPTF